MENKKSSSHWGYSLFGLIIGGLVVAAVFSSGKQIMTYSLWLALFAAGYVVRWVALKVWAQYKTPAVVAGTVDCVVEPQAQPILTPVTATQPVQQINKTVVASIVAAVIAVAAIGYIAIVISANQQYELAVAQQDKAMGAWNNAINARVEAEREKPAKPSKYMSVFDDPTFNVRYIDEGSAKNAYEAATDAVEKAQQAKDYPLASLFNKADVE